MKEKLESEIENGKNTEKVEETAKSSIEDVIDKNLSNEIFLKAVSFSYPEKIDKETLTKAFEKLRQAETGISEEEKERLFKGALEYFSENKEIRYPIGHATGSESLKMIIGDELIKAGGSGETGEGAGYLRSLQESVSVAEMNNPTAMYLELEYAMASANKELTKALLKVDADEIDKTTLLEDYLFIRIAANPELILRMIGESADISQDKLKKEIAKNNNTTMKNITPKMIIENQRIQKPLKSAMESAVEKKHYKTLEGEQRSFEGLTRIMKACDEGVLPSCEYKGKILSDPEEILKQGRLDGVPKTVEEKVFRELWDQYDYYLNTYKDENGKSLTFEDFMANKEKYLSGMKDWLKQGQYDRLLCPLPEDSEQKKLEKMERLEILDNQYPVIIIVEGQKFIDNQQTYSLQNNGEKPLETMPAEERIMADIPSESFREIMVPEEKIPEVQEWLDAKDIKGIKIVPFEYFEIQRMVGHQVDIES